MTYIWRAGMGTWIPVDRERALRLHKAGESVSPNPAGWDQVEQQDDPRDSGSPVVGTAADKASGK